MDEHPPPTEESWPKPLPLLAPAEPDAQETGEEVEEGTSICSSCGVTILGVAPDAGPLFCRECQLSIQENDQALAQEHEARLANQGSLRLIWGVVLGAIVLLMALALVLSGI